MFKLNTSLCKVFFLKTKVDRLQGADPTTLESKILQYYGSEEGEDVEGVAGHVSLLIYPKKIVFLLYTINICINFFSDGFKSIY